MAKFNFQLKVHSFLTSRGWAGVGKIPLFFKKCSNLKDRYLAMFFRTLRRQDQLFLIKDSQEQSVLISVIDFGERFSIFDLGK